MINRKNRYAFLIILALVITTFLVFAFSPTVRAALETILSFNGVNVSIDKDTGKLVVSGNMDAVVDQTDYSVEIKGENGNYAGAGIASAQASQSVDVDDFLTSHPDLSLPTVPARYTMQPQVELAGDSMTFTWQDSSGHLITYQRSSASCQGGATCNQKSSSELPAAPGIQPTPVIHSGNGFTSFGGKYNYSGPMITYDWESNGYYHELYVMDTTMSEADLQAMLP